jgi:hypothetical protein
MALMTGTIDTAGIDVARVFGWVFLSAMIFLTISLICLIIMEERPLRGGTSSEPPASPAATPTPVPPPAPAP